MKYETKRGLRTVISIMLAVFLSNIIKSIIGLEYFMPRDGLSYKLLIDFVIYMLIFSISYFIFGKVLLNKSNKNYKK